MGKNIMKLPSNRPPLPRRLIAALTTLALAAFALRAAAGPSLSTLYSFTNSVNPVGAAVTAMVQGTNGNFYGTTLSGGTNGMGSIFMVTPGGAFTTLVSFNGSNGSAPAAPLFLDADGNFYGTTSNGSAHNVGVIFKMTHSGVLTDLAAFAQSNGAAPVGPVVRGPGGYFFGTTSAGGSNGAGEIFSWAPHLAISNRYSFSTTDGASPEGGLVFGTNFNLYGTTFKGGANGYGTAFRFNPVSNSFTSLASFTLTNGAFPTGLAAASNGLFYGATSFGGNNNEGTLFQLTTSGALTSLISLSVTNGSSPESPLVVGNDGFVYGTALQGGANGKGAVFRFSTNSGTTTGSTGGGRSGRGGSTGSGTTTSNSVVITNLISFSGFNGANPVGGLTLANDGNFYGVTTAGGANNYGNIFKILGFPPSIFQRPTNQNFASNATARFTVGAAGTQPLAYQWLLDGTNLSASASISGVTNSQLVIASEVLTDAGSYSVVVTNAYGAATSSVATLTVPTPTVTIHASPAHVSDDTNLFTGTAFDRYGVSSVQWQINSNAWTSAVIGSRLTNWSALATLQPGTNVFRAYSVDPLGNHSVTSSVTIFYLTRSTLTLLVNGSGTISRRSLIPFGPPLIGTNLVVGSNYSVTAIPSVNNFFSNWTGSITTTNNPLTFLMMSNMVLQANFVTNSFIGAAGAYVGLFYSSNSPGAESTGLLTDLIVKGSGAYSGKLLLPGATYPVSGMFNLVGNSSNQITRATNLGPISLSLHLDWDIKPPLITGTVQGSDSGGWTSQLTNEIYSTGLGSAEYTMLVPAAADAPTNAPAGSGYALIADNLGRTAIYGVMADGAGFSQGVAVTENLKIPFFAPLYTNRGVVFGWLDLSGNSPTGNVTWVRESHSGRLFTNGFTNTITVQSSPWTNLGGSASAISLPHGAQLDLSGGTLAAPLDFGVVLSSNNVLSKAGALPTNSFSGSIAPKNGLLTVTFGNGDHQKTTTGYGAVLQNQNSAGGYFITTTNTGSIVLSPNP